MSDETATREKRHFLYLGLSLEPAEPGSVPRRTEDTFILPNDYANDGQPIEVVPVRTWDFNTINRGANPGEIYEVEVSFGEGNHITIYGTKKAGYGKYIGRWKCKEQVTQWTAEHRAALLTFQNAQAVKKDRDIDPYYEMLQAVHEAYIRLSPTMRRSLLVDVLSIIITGRK
jgi:hypothetical protein